MTKKLIFILAIIVGLNMIFPDAPKAEDTSKVFIYGTGFAVVPTDDGAAEYDPYFGFQFEGHYKVGQNVSIGATYKSWQQRADLAKEDLVAEYKGGFFTYWVNPYGEEFNLGFMAGIGQAKVTTADGTNGDKSEIFGMIVKINLFKNIAAVGTAQIGSFGDTDEDALMISVGVGAPISF